MRLLPLPGGGLKLRLEHDEAALLSQLVSQLIKLLESHSRTPLDPDPLFASLEVGGTDESPADPALARLLPDAYDDETVAADFRRVTEQGLINRKLQDAMTVTAALSIDDTRSSSIDVEISGDRVPVWARTLTALRLAIAARLGMEEESDHATLMNDESTRGTMLVYDWLAAILDSVLRMAPEPDTGTGSGTDSDRSDTADE